MIFLNCILPISLIISYCIAWWQIDRGKLILCMVCMNNGRDRDSCNVIAQMFFALIILLDKCFLRCPYLDICF